MRKNSIQNLTVSAILIALGIVIPMIMPKIIIGPASFTPASHVPLFIAMFFSPGVAVAVALGTAFGFFITTTPIIALRALSHIVFAVIGSVYLQKNPTIVLNKKKFQIYNAVIALIHTVCEILVVAVFFMTGAGSYKDSMFSLFMIMGIGGFIHSMLDYDIAYFISEGLNKITNIPVFAMAKKDQEFANQKTQENASK